MARGWESKSVEAQQAEAREKSTEKRSKLTPEAAARQRARENLRLSRQRVLQQLAVSQNPLLRKSLEAALSELNEKIKHLEK
ncbi:MAG TPA: hypothetical protein VKB60_00485 [Terriglobales bacterium]|nr:hypothetical protein [Terriglobales bacterium]